MPKRKAFRKAVLAAFDYEGLKQALAEAPNSRDLGDLVSPEASFDDRTAQLITRSIKEGWVQELLQTLLEARRQTRAIKGYLSRDEAEILCLHRPTAKVIVR